MELPPGAVLLDGNFGTSVVNATDVPNEEVYRAIEQQDRSLFETFRQWAQDVSGPMQAWDTSSYSSGHPSHPGPRNREGNLWNRDRYVQPSTVIDQMRLARVALLEDDIVAGVEEGTEALAFSNMAFFAEDPDEEDVYNQIARKIDLDARMREMWRELYTVSQVYVAVLREQQTFKVRGTTKGGNQRRKEYTVVAPTNMVVLDPTKVVPVGSPYANAFSGREAYAYVATRNESEQFIQILDEFTTVYDDVVPQVIVGPYRPDPLEAAELTALGIDITHLWLLDSSKVFGHRLTTPGYHRLADVRMKSVFELLDMKHQLRQMERAHVLGGTSFIVIVTKGTDAHPALPVEIQNLQAQVRTVARVPILVGDHRLKVEIVTPKIDTTLRAERWNTLDSRLSARLYGLFHLGLYNAGASGDDSIKLVKVLARALESRRHMIRRCLEKHVFDPLFDNNDAFTARPKLQFHPRSIALDFDAAYASFLFDLRQANELSRETILNQFDLDQDLEAELRKREEELYDKVFQTQVPFSTPNPALPVRPGIAPIKSPTPQPGQEAPAQQPAPALPKDNGGGRRNGGGAAPGSGQGQPPRRRAARNAAQPSAARLTISLEGVDDASRNDVLAALRAALAEGEDNADAT